MPTFQFTPQMSACYDSYVVEHEFLTPSEIDQILELGYSNNLKAATVSANKMVVPETRTSNVSWISFKNDTSWLFQKMADKVRQINALNFRFDLWGIVEDMQFTVYDGDARGHYGWHQDEFYKNGLFRAPRKLSMVIQLSDPMEYECGDLELHLHGDNPIKIPKGKGTLAVFPSWCVHRVTPVTQGVRKSLVCWVTGPSFK